MDDWSELEHKIIIAVAKEFNSNKSSKEKKKLEEEKYVLMRRCLIKKGFNRSLEEIKIYYGKCLAAVKKGMKVSGAKEESSSNINQRVKDLSQSRVLIKHNVENGLNNLPECSGNQIQTKPLLISNENLNSVINDSTSNKDLSDSSAHSNNKSKEQASSPSKIQTKDNKATNENIHEITEKTKSCSGKITKSEIKKNRNEKLSDCSKNIHSKDIEKNHLKKSLQSLITSKQSELLMSDSQNVMVNIPNSSNGMTNSSAIEICKIDKQFDCSTNTHSKECEETNFKKPSEGLITLKPSEKLIGEVENCENRNEIFERTGFIKDKSDLENIQNKKRSSLRIKSKGQEQLKEAEKILSPGKKNINDHEIEIIDKLNVSEDNNNINNLDIAVKTSQPNNVTNRPKRKYIDIKHIKDHEITAIISEKINCIGNNNRTNTSDIPQNTSHGKSLTNRKKRKSVDSKNVNDHEITEIKICEKRNCIGNISNINTSDIPQKTSHTESVKNSNKRKSVDIKNVNDHEITEIKISEKRNCIGNINDINTSDIPPKTYTESVTNGNNRKSVDSKNINKYEISEIKISEKINCIANKKGINTFDISAKTSHPKNVTNSTQSLADDTFCGENVTQIIGKEKCLSETEERIYTATKRKGEMGNNMDIELTNCPENNKKANVGKRRKLIRNNDKKNCGESNTMNEISSLDCVYEDKNHGTKLMVNTHETENTDSNKEGSGREETKLNIPKGNIVCRSRQLNNNDDEHRYDSKNACKDRKSSERLGENNPTHHNLPSSSQSVIIDCKEKIIHSNSEKTSEIASFATELINNKTLINNCENSTEIIPKTKMLAHLNMISKKTVFPNNTIGADEGLEFLKESENTNSNNFGKGKPSKIYNDMTKIPQISEMNKETIYQNNSQIVAPVDDKHQSKRYISNINTNTVKLNSLLKTNCLPTEEIYINGVNNNNEQLTMVNSILSSNIDSQNKSNWIGSEIFMDKLQTDKNIYASIEREHAAKMPINMTELPPVIQSLPDDISTKSLSSEGRETVASQHDKNQNKTNKRKKGSIQRKHYNLSIKGRLQKIEKCLFLLNKRVRRMEKTTVNKLNLIFKTLNK